MGRRFEVARVSVLALRLEAAVRQPSILRLTLFFFGPVLLAALMLGLAGPGAAVVLSLVAGNGAELRPQPTRD
jgi:hypothetical protein